MQDKRFYYAQFGRGNNVDLVRYVLLTRPWWCEAPSGMRFNMRWQMFAPEQKVFNELCAGEQIYSHLPNWSCLHSKLSYYQLLTRYFGPSCYDFVMPTYLFYGADKERFLRHYKYISSALHQQTGYQPVIETAYEPNQQTDLQNSQKTSSKAHLQTSQDIQHSMPANATVEQPSLQALTPQTVELTPEMEHTPPEDFRQNLWILKPLALNRGRGIRVVSTPEEAESHVELCRRAHISAVTSLEDISNAGGRSQWLIQKYIERPLLINGRKFDIRVYALALDNGDCFLYHTGYLRLSGAAFSLETTDLAVHLTNNAVQQYIDTYQAFEEGNMMSFAEFDAYLAGKADFYGAIWPKIQRLMARIMEVASLKLIQRAYCKNCFELFGFDFMIDTQYNPWAIEVNSNPCLELSSAVSWSILPYLLDDMFELTIDKTFPPPPEVVTLFKSKMDRATEAQRPTKEEISKIPPQERRITGLKWQCLYSDSAPQRKNGFMQVVRHFKRCKDFAAGN